MTTAQVIAEALAAERACQADINKASTVVAASKLSTAEKNSVHASLAKASGDLNTSIKDLAAWVPDPVPPPVPPPTPPPVPPPAPPLPVQTPATAVPKTAGSNAPSPFPLPTPWPPPSQFDQHVGTLQFDDTFFVGSAPNISLSLDSSKQYEVADLATGVVLASGPVSAMKVAFPMLPAGAYRLRLVGSTIDPIIGNVTGALNLLVVNKSANLPAPPASSTPDYATDVPGVILLSKPNPITDTGSGMGESGIAHGVFDIGPIRFGFPNVTDDTGATQKDASAAQYVTWWTNLAKDYLADLNSAAETTYGFTSVKDPARPARQHLVSFINWGSNNAGAAAVTAVAKVLGTKVKYESRNEPDNGGSGQQYTGAQFVPIFQAFCDAVEAGCPTATICGPSPTTIGLNETGWWNDFFGNGGSQIMLGHGRHGGLNFELWTHLYNTRNGDAFCADDVFPSFTNNVITPHGLGALPRGCSELGGDFMIFGGLYTPLNQLIWRIQQVLTLERYGWAGERLYHFYTSSRGFWDQPSWICTNPIAVALRAWSDARHGKTFAAEIDFDNAAPLVRGYIMSGSLGQTAALFTTGVANLPVTLTVSGPATAVDWAGNSVAVNQVGTEVTVNVGQLPVYVSASIVSSDPVDAGLGLMAEPNVLAGATVTASGAVNQTNLQDLTTGKLLRSSYSTGEDLDDSTGPYTDSNNIMPVSLTFKLKIPTTAGRAIIQQPPAWHQVSTLVAFTIDVEDAAGWHNGVFKYDDSVDATSFPFADWANGSGCSRETTFGFVHAWIAQFDKTYSGITAVRLNITKTTFGGDPDQLTENSVAYGVGCPQRFVAQLVSLVA